MRIRTFLFSTATLVSWLTTASAFAQTIYLADNFEEATDSTTFLGNSSIGGDPNGDADPNAPQAGFWDSISEPQAYKIQVTQGMTGPGPGPPPGVNSPAYPGPGPASGVNALAIERSGGGSEIRGDFEEAATGVISVEYDLWVHYGQSQFFPRNGSVGAGVAYDGYPILVNFTATGQAQIDNGPLTAPFYTVDMGTGPADIEYNHVEFLIDLPAQRFSLSVDGQTLPELTNRAFATNGAGGTQPVSQLLQVAFGTPTGEDAYYIDNLIVQTATAPPVGDADFDNDMDVDGADFLVWQRGLGGDPLPNNGNADGDSDIDGEDLAVWKSEFGTPQVQAAGVAIPEPCSAALLGLGGLALALVRRSSAAAY